MIIITEVILSSENIFFLGGGQRDPAVSNVPATPLPSLPLLMKAHLSRGLFLHTLYVISVQTNAGKPPMTRSSQAAHFGAFSNHNCGRM